MKIIHTADWHLGNRMHDIERGQEFKNFLEWLKNKIQEENAQALVVSGDIFDTANPPTEARKQYHQFLASLLNTCCKNVIIVGGNHDSGALLDSEKEIFEALNIHVVGTVSNIRPDDMVFELFDEKDDVCGICAAVPFAREIELRDYFDDEVSDGEFSDKAYGALYKKVAEVAKKLKGKRNIPLIATGHLYAANLEGRFESTAGEIHQDDGRRILDVVGKLGVVHESVFPADFDYVALGHIHYTSMVCKNPKIRYSGSPFILGFDEAHLPRHILAVELENGKEAFVTKIEVPKTVNYRRLSGDCATIRCELEKYLQRTEDSEVYLELYYKREEGINIHDELEPLLQKLKDKQVFVASRRVQDVKSIIHGSTESYDMEELKNLSPEKIFMSLLLAKCSSENKEIIESKYLPLLMQNFAAYENGELQDENNKN